MQIVNHEDQMIKMAEALDAAALELRNAAEYDTGRIVRWEKLRDAALKFARQHDRYVMADAVTGGEQLVGQFVELQDRFRHSVVGRIGTNTFKVWCMTHGREIGVPEHDSYPTRGDDVIDFSEIPEHDSYPYFTRGDDAWVIDLSEIICPEDDESSDESECVSSWVVLEVVDRDLIGKPLPKISNIGAVLRVIGDGEGQNAK